ncbi:LLM class flavin-dependent oxidoreductase [Streptomyces sp. B21-083]|uniref:LLM class flavin-dependent oxidoreductase n=1 Tax=Streptomyces sp. B21-083 TaxID=3039410 RepID=UPI002FF159CB
MTSGHDHRARTAPELSCGLPPGPDFTDLAVLAEELGYTRVWIYDSAPLWEDPFIHLALAARRTTRIVLATAVLVPEERSIMTMVSSIATIARLMPGRLRACFGTGFTARRALSRTPMRLDTFTAYVDAVRRLPRVGPPWWTAGPLACSTPPAWRRPVR